MEQAILMWSAGAALVAPARYACMVRSSYGLGNLESEVSSLRFCGTLSQEAPMEILQLN
jgi:hypothetical protein